MDAQRTKKKAIERVLLNQRVRAWRDSTGLKPYYLAGDTGMVTAVNPNKNGGLKIKLDNGRVVFWCDPRNWETEAEHERRQAAVDKATADVERGVR